MSALAAAAWSTLAFVALNGLLLISVWLWPSSMHDLVHIGVCEAVVLLGIGALALRAHAPQVPLSRALAFRPTPSALLLVCFAVGLCLRIPADSLREWVEILSPTPEDVLLAQAELLRHDTALDSALLFLVLAFGGPFVEEVFYRGVLFGPLVRSSGLALAIIITSVVFVLAHGQWRDFLALLPVALLLGYTRAISGSLLPALALHSAFNLSAVWALLVGAASATEPLQLPIWATVAAWAAVFALTFIGGRLALHSPLSIAARYDDQG